MAGNKLVDADIDSGLQLVKALDDAGFGVTAALWLYHSDTDKWKFLVACDFSRDSSPERLAKKYLEAATIVSRYREGEGKPPILDLSRVRIVSDADPLIVGLKPIVHVDGLGRVQFSNNLVNGIYVEDALIHRLAA